MAKFLYESEYALVGVLSGLSADLQIKGSLVRFPVRAHARVVGHVLSEGHMRGSHTNLFPSPI